MDLVPTKRKASVVWRAQAGLHSRTELASKIANLIEVSSRSDIGLAVSIHSSCGSDRSNPGDAPRLVLLGPSPRAPAASLVLNAYKQTRRHASAVFSATEMILDASQMVRSGTEKVSQPLALAKFSRRYGLSA